jgi:carbonic anhydrase
MKMKTVEITYRYSAQEVPTRARPTDAETARRRLDEGSQAFSTLLDGMKDGSGVAKRIVEIDPRELGLVEADMSGPKQRPFAAVLGCSDARVPVELIFNEGPNDLFVIRVAGNGLGSDVLGSLRYAVEHLGGSLKIIVVLGHSGCGAVSAAVDVFLQPAQYLPLATSYALRAILDRLLVVVQASAKRLQEICGPDVSRRPGYRSALIETSVITNAALSAYTLQQELDTHEPTGIRAVYGIYLLATHQIWAPHRDTGTWTGLADPPADLAAFVAFGDAVIQSERITMLLNTN